jgi:hypothetical protein
VPEEQDVHADHDGHHREHVKHDGYPASHGCPPSHRFILVRTMPARTNALTVGRGSQYLTGACHGEHVSHLGVPWPPVAVRWGSVRCLGSSWADCSRVWARLARLLRIVGCAGGG